jgi:hypothetical protein
MKVTIQPEPPIEPRFTLTLQGLTRAEIATLRHAFHYLQGRTDSAEAKVFLITVYDTIKDLGGASLAT